MTVMDVIGYDRLLPGDFNRDGQVNAADIPAMLAALADLTAYQTSKNLSGPQLVLLGDIDGDGAVTNADIQSLLELLKSGGGSLASVPEPAIDRADGSGRTAFGCVSSCQCSPSRLHTIHGAEIFVLAATSASRGCPPESILFHSGRDL